MRFAKHTVSDRTFGYLLAVVGASLFASKAIVVKLAYLAGDSGERHEAIFDPISLLTLRMSFALPVYLVIGTVHYRKRRVSGQPLPIPADVVKIGVAGSSGYYLASFFDFSGLVFITAQLERLILFTYPVFVVILGALFFRHRITLKSVIAIGLAYFGLAIVLLNGKTAQSENLTAGVLFVLAAALAFALYQLVAQPLMRRIGSVMFTCIAMAGAAICVLTHFAVSAMMSTPSLDTMLSRRILFLAGILGVFCTIIPSFL